MSGPSPGSSDERVHHMDQHATESLAKFCIAQRNAFDPDDWYAQFDINPKAVALAAKYLSLTSWYGHEEELEQIASEMDVFVESSHGLYRELHAIGFDLAYFSYMVRIGVTQSRIEQKAGSPAGELAAVLRPFAEGGNVRSGRAN